MSGQRKSFDLFIEYNRLDMEIDTQISRTVFGSALNTDEPPYWVRLDRQGSAVLAFDRVIPFRPRQIIMARAVSTVAMRTIESLYRSDIHAAFEEARTDGYSYYNAPYDRKFKLSAAWLQATAPETPEDLREISTDFLAGQLYPQIEYITE